MTEGLEGLLAGRTLVGRYRIEEVIGRGGFAVVYRAEDLRLGRPVAVKVITPATLEPDARERLRQRFQQEARAAASLPHHPNVVAIHDFGTDAGTGIDFLAMELLRGETLGQFLARDPRPPLSLALGVVRDAAEGLAIGHRAGIIHRDVKPGNLFLAEPHDPGDAFRVCVLDFGIARLVDGGDLTLTGHEGVPLSPAYASPEQLRGERELTAATDVFSLGAVAFQLLAGRKPLAGDRAAADAAAALPRTTPPVPPGIAAVVERALHPDPAGRYPNAEGFAEALDVAAADGERIRLGPVPPADDDRTLLQAPAPVPAATIPPARGRRRGAWLLLLPLLVAAGALWALRERGGEPGAGPPVDTAVPVVEEADGSAAPPPAVEAGGAASAPGETTPPAPAPPVGGTPAEPSPAQPVSPPVEPLPPQQPPPEPPQPRPTEPVEPRPTEPVRPRPTEPVQPPPRPTEPVQPPPRPTEPVQPPPRPTEPVPVLPPPAPRDTLRLPPPPGSSEAAIPARARARGW